MSTEPLSSGTDRNAAAVTLSAEDIHRLLEDRSTATLVDITGKIAGGYHPAMKPGEAEAAEQIFRLLMRQTETQVRVALAQHVKSSRTLPRDIALSLARDVEEVALPLLEYSEALSESDLMELVQSTDAAARHLAICRRDYVPEKLSDTLIAGGNEEVAATLVQNIGASISETGMNSIVERFPENKPLMSALVSRPQLPATVAEKLISHVSSSLARTLRDKYGLPDQEIEQQAEQAREGETLKLVRQLRSPEELDRLIGQLMAFDRLTPSLILSALCHGNIPFFETALARLSGVAVANARALVSDKGDLGFRAIYNKSGLPDTMFPAVRTLLATVRMLDGEGEKPGSPHYANRVVERLLSCAEESPVENLSYIIALVRRGQ